MNPITFILQVIAGQNMMIIALLKMIVILLGAITFIMIYNQFDLKTKRQRLTQGGKVVITKIGRAITGFVDNRK